MGKTRKGHGVACVAGVERGRGNLGAHESVWVSRPNSLPLPFRTPATQARHGAEKRKGQSFLPFIIFVLALSQFSGPDYLGAWNRLVLDGLCDGNRDHFVNITAIPGRY